MLSSKQRRIQAVLPIMIIILIMMKEATRININSLSSSSVVCLKKIYEKLCKDIRIFLSFLLFLLTASAYLVVQVELLMKSWFLAQNLIQVYLKNYLYFPSLLPSILMKIQYSTFSSCKICSVSFDTTKEGALFIFSFHCIKLIF